MIATVAICTHNSGSRLQPTLEAVAALEFDPSEFEVVIVDNASTDTTGAIAREFAASRSGRLAVRVVREEQVGLSHARNRAIAECRGKILVFTDDDVTPAPDWLAKIVAVYQAEPQAGCVGGKIVLRLPPIPLPAWYDERLAGYLAARDLGVEQRLECKEIWQFPYGANISFSKAVLEKLGGFLTHLGRSGRGMMSGEETEMCLRIARDGYRIFYEPAAVVEHHIAASRFRRDYFAGHADGQGPLQAVWDNGGAWGVSKPGQLGRYWLDFRWNFKRWLLGPYRDEVERFQHYLNARKYWQALLYVAWNKRAYRFQR